MSIILACTDGSVYASSVYQHTAWAAKKTGVPVKVLHALDPHREEPTKTDHSGRISLGARSTLLTELVELEAERAKVARRQGTMILNDAHTQLKQAGVTKVDTEQKHGRLSDLIQSSEQDAELVIIGKRGNHADFEKGHLGHNLERVVRSCQHPVLVAAREFKAIERFAIAFDGGESVMKAVEYAATQPLLKDMHCQLLYVGRPHQDMDTALEKAQKTLAQAGVQATAKQIDGEPANSIAETVKTDQLDLLVMGAYSHTKIRHLFVGSTTTAMIRTVKIPVLLFR